jgi:hypothetical protein
LADSGWDFGRFGPRDNPLVVSYIDEYSPSAWQTCRVFCTQKCPVLEVDIEFFGLSIRRPPEDDSACLSLRFLGRCSLLIPVSDDCSNVERLALMDLSLQCILGVSVGGGNAVPVGFSLAEAVYKAPEDILLEVIGLRPTNLIPPTS